jgi:hypothetical protein
MTGDDIERPWLSWAEVERTLDRAIDGLVKMDVEVLMQLARHCGDWEARRPLASFSNAAHERLSWKLILLDRLLRQMHLNLSVLGLTPGQYSPAEGYRAFARR